MIITQEHRNMIQTARETIGNNAWNLIKNASIFFSQRQYPISCFLAMTAIEEIGKLCVLRIIQGDNGFFQIAGRTEIDPDRICSYFRKHPQKATEAVIQALYINSAADRRHGMINGTLVTSGLISLIRVNSWMSLRNSCLYVDVNFNCNSTNSPNSSIQKEHAYYFICMAHEIVIEIAEYAFLASSTDKYFKITNNFRDEVLNSLTDFMNSYNSTVNLSELDFLANAEKYRRKAYNSEANK